MTSQLDLYACFNVTLRGKGKNKVIIQKTKNGEVDGSGTFHLFWKGC